MEFYELIVDRCFAYSLVNKNVLVIGISIVLVNDGRHANQVAYEGGMDQKTVSMALRRGTRGDGDLIPWIIEEKVAPFEYS